MSMAVPHNESYKLDNQSRTALEVFAPHNVTQVPSSWGLTNAAEAGNETKTVWHFYTEKGYHYDEDLVKDSNNTVDVLLVFAGLFSAVLSAFIQTTYPMLKPDNANSKSPPYAVSVNCCLFAGLFISIFVALLGIFVKQWARSYQHDLEGVSSAHLRARIRHYRYTGVKKWNFAGFVAFLSICMNLALIISAIGILQLLFATAPKVAFVAVTVFAIGSSIVIVTGLIPVFHPDAPFRSPLSKLFVWVAEKVHEPAQERGFKGKDDEENQAGTLGDGFKLSTGRVTKENGIVRTQLELDLDILTHLMERADRSTERWVLDLCIQRLPNLTLLAKKSPQLILGKDIIYEVYVFLANGCLLEGKPGGREVDPHRRGRSKDLCTFLRWFLSIERSTGSRDTINFQLKKLKFDVKELPNALAKDPNAASAAAALAALGCVEHLDSYAQDCEICNKRLNRIEDKTQSRDDMMRDITMVIIGFSDCLRPWDRSGQFKADKEYVDWCNKRCNSALACLKSALTLRDPPDAGDYKYKPQDKEKRVWEAALEQERSVREELRTGWFTPLKKLIESVPTLVEATSASSQPSQGAQGRPRSSSSSYYSPAGPNPPTPSVNTEYGFLSPPAHRYQVF